MSDVAITLRPQVVDGKAAARDVTEVARAMRDLEAITKRIQLAEMERLRQSGKDSDKQRLAQMELANALRRQEAANESAFKAQETIRKRFIEQRLVDQKKLDFAIQKEAERKKKIADQQLQAQQRLNVVMREQEERQSRVVSQQVSAQQRLNVILQEQGRQKRALLGGLGAVSPGAGGLVGSFMQGGAIGGGIALGTALISGIGSAAGAIKNAAVAIYESGRDNAELRAKFTREFQGRGSRLMDLGADAGSRAGVGSAGQAAMLEMARAMPDFSAGMQVSARLAAQLGMGGRRKLTDDDIGTLQGQMEERRAKIYARVQTLNPNMDPAHLGRMISNALISGTGVKALASELGLSKSAMRLAAASEAGKVGKLGISQGGLSADEKKQFKTIDGKLPTFDLLNLVLQRGGVTDEAMEEKRKGLEFQIQSIKSQLADVVGDIGEQVFNNLQGPLAKSVPLAQRLRDYLASDEGKAAVKSISQFLSDAARSIGVMVATLPQFISDLRKAAELVGKVSMVFQYIGSPGVAAREGIEEKRQSALRTIAAKTASDMVNEGASQAPGTVVEMNGMQITVGVGKTHTEIVEELMPQIERQLVNGLNKQNPTR